MPSTKATELRVRRVALPALTFRAVAQDGELKIAEFDTTFNLTAGNWMVALDFAPKDCDGSRWRREERTFSQLQSGLQIPEDYCQHGRVRARIVDARTSEPLTEWSAVSDIETIR